MIVELNDFLHPQEIFASAAIKKVVNMYRYNSEDDKLDEKLVAELDNGNYLVARFTGLKSDSEVGLVESEEFDNYFDALKFFKEEV